MERMVTKVGALYEDIIKEDYDEFAKIIIEDRLIRV